MKQRGAKKVLVTGGVGFIGSRIVEGLLKIGVDTISIDDYFVEREENLARLKDSPDLNEITCYGMVLS